MGEVVAVVSGMVCNGWRGKAGVEMQIKKEDK